MASAKGNRNQVRENDEANAEMLAMEEELRELEAAPAATAYLAPINMKLVERAMKAAEYRAGYNRRPDVKAKRAEYTKLRNQTEEAKAARKAYNQKRNQDPTVQEKRKATQKEYNKAMRDAVKALPPEQLEAIRARVAAEIAAKQVVADSN